MENSNSVWAYGLLSVAAPFAVVAAGCLADAGSPEEGEVGEAEDALVEADQKEGAVGTAGPIGTVTITETITGTITATATTTKTSCSQLDCDNGAACKAGNGTAGQCRYHVGGCGCSSLKSIDIATGEEEWVPCEP